MTDVRRALLDKRLQGDGRMAADDVARIVADGHAGKYELLCAFFGKLSRDVQQRQFDERIEAFAARHTAMSDRELWACVETPPYTPEACPMLPFTQADRDEIMAVLRYRASIPDQFRPASFAPCISKADLEDYVASNVPPFDLADVFERVASLPDLMIAEFLELTAHRAGKAGRPRKGEKSKDEIAQEVAEKYRGQPGALDQRQLLDDARIAEFKARKQ